MYLQHVEFHVVPETYRDWQVYLPNYLAAQARQPGGVSFRVLRDLNEPYRFLSVRTWLSKEHALVSRATPEMDLAGKPSQDSGFYAGKPAVWHEANLWDMVWGLEGGDIAMQRGHFVHTLATGYGPGKYDAWAPYVRNFSSVMARHPGVVSLEVLMPVRDATPSPGPVYVAEPANRVYVLRTFTDREASRAGPEGNPSPELRLCLEPGSQANVYQGMPPVVYHEYEVYDAVWGLEGPAACQRFMRSLKPF